MDRRKFIKKAGLLGGATFLQGPLAQQYFNKGNNTSGDKPNLLFVFADQLRTQSMGYFGGYADDPAPHTPALDQLQSESIDFRNAIANTPLCSPFRASLLTGKHTSSHGQIRNEIRVLPDPDSIGHVLGANGYNRGWIGKWHLYDQQYIPPGEHRMGFDQEWKGFNFNHDYYNGFYYEDQNYRYQVDGYEPIKQTDMAIDYMTRRAGDDDPFALFLSLGPPHRPWGWNNVPDEYADLFRGKEFPDPPNYEDGHGEYWVRSWDHDWWMNYWKPNRMRFRQVYAAMTASVDAQIKRLRQSLEDLGIADNTIVVFTSDHGEMFGSQGRIQKNVIFEEAARIPFLIHWPGKIEPRVVDTALNAPDMAPTVLSLMGLPVPESMEGEDLSHIALNEPGPEKDFAFMQIMGHAFQWRDSHEWRAIRTKQYTYAYRLKNDLEYLFDNIADPYQINNQADNPAWEGIRKELSILMQLQMNQLNDRFLPQSYYRNHWMDGNQVVRTATRDSTTTDIKSEPVAASIRDFSLESNYPNPFNSQTQIQFFIKEKGTYELTVYGRDGKRIKTLLKRSLNPGRYQRAWDGTNELGANVSSGLYIYTLRNQRGKTISRVMTLLK